MLVDPEGHQNQMLAEVHIVTQLFGSLRSKIRIYLVCSPLFRLIRNMDLILPPLSITNPVPQNRTKKRPLFEVSNFLIAFM